MKNFDNLSRVEQHAFPGARGSYSEPPPLTNADTLWMTTRDGDWIAGIYVPGAADNDLCLVHFYGHNETLRDAEFPSQALRRLDSALLCFDYRGYGASTGRPSESSFYTDAEFAFDWLVDNYPAARIVACGRSIGAAVATHLASVRPVHGLALFSPPTNMIDVIRPIFPPDEIVIEEAIPFRFDTLSSIAKVRCPVFVCHGAADRLIPITMSEMLASAARKDVVRLTVPEGGHEDLFTVGGERLWISLGTFLAGL